MGHYDESGTSAAAATTDGAVPMYTAAILIVALVFIIGVRRGFDGFVPSL